MRRPMTRAEQANLLGAGGHEAEALEKAVRLIQDAVFRRLLSRVGDGAERKRICLQRRKLLERLNLELEFSRGIRLFVLCLAMFLTVIGTAIRESQSAVRLGTLESIKLMFRTDELGGIKNPDQFFEYMQFVSEQSRELMPTSSAFFREEEGGFMKFPTRGLAQPRRKAQDVSIAGLEPRIDSSSFTFIAWVQMEEDEAVSIVEKPLGRDALEAPGLYCWQWRVGGASDMFVFGAHDFSPAPDALQEEQVTVRAGRSNVSDGSLHLMAVVVNQTQISFFKDAEMYASVPISRVVTDCLGTRLVIGRSENGGSFKLGEFFFYPRSLNAIEMREIQDSGHILQNIASGKIAFAPPGTGFDYLKTENGKGFGRSADALGSLDRDLAIEGILNRAHVEPTTPPRHVHVLNVPRSTPCREILSFGSGVGDEAPCRIVRDIQQVEDQDLANKTYYNLFTPSLTQGRDPKGLFRFPAFILNSEAPNYDPSTFPSWCGQSISVSVWGKFTVGGYLLGRYRHSKDPWPIGDRSVAQYWSLFVYSDGRGTSMQFALNSTVKSTWDTAEHAPTYKDEINPVLHHVGITVDVIKNEVRLYTDGALDSVVNYDHIDPRLLAKVDCSMDQPMTYIPLAHRPPGFGTPSNTMSDWRLYVGEDNKLSDDDMMTLAYGQNRECKTEVEGHDSLYKDAAGHSCAWYSEMVKIAPAICSNERVRTECPIACGVIVDCYTTRSSGVEVSKNVVWNRIMPITPRAKGENVMCVRAGLDVQESCARANRAWGNAPGELDEVTVKDEIFHRTITRADIDVLDCAQMKRHVDPYCEFSLENDWGLHFHSKVHASKGLTVSFWIKFSADTLLPANIILYASVYPPRVLARIRFQDNGVIYIRIYSSCGKSENVKPTWTVTHGEWGFVSFIIGATQQGQTGLLGVYNSATSFDPVGLWEWCVPDWPQFLEGIQMPGNMLVSSIEVQNTAVPTKRLLKRYYDEVARYRFRPGPASRRAPSGIQYDRAKKMSSLTLVAPPLVLMRRRTPSSNCSTALGSTYVKSLWQSTVTGVTCQSPYQCDSALLHEPTELLSCSQDEREGNASFFGKEPLLQRHGGSADSTPQFWEFLQSIADASVLVRDQVYFTSNFIDAQTSTVRITMVSFAAEHGIASIFDITANFFERVSVDYSIRHAQSLEDDDLEEYRSLVIFALLLSSVILIEKIWTFWHLTEHGKNEKRASLFVDLVLQVVLPIIYLSLRLSQKSESREMMLRVMGSDGLTGVKWASTDLSPQTKIASFFDALMRLEEKMQTESVMSYCYFFLALCTLLRLVKQTDFHPRLAILVGILETAVDDLFHFLLLMCVVMGGFLALAIAQFAGEKDYFSDAARGFETMFNLMMGSVPPNGPNNSEFWMQNSQLMVLTLCYSLLVFFTLLNVIIAIIVIAHQEIYDNVKNLEADNNIITDLGLTVVQTIKSILFKWPSHVTLINELEKNRCIMVDYKILRTLAPGWKQKSIISFLKQYEGCSYMTVSPNFRDFLKPSGMSNESYHACDEMERRVAALLRVPTSTLGQRLTADMRPRVSGVKRASNAGGAKGCRDAGGCVGSSARITECTRSDAESSSQHIMRSSLEFEGEGRGKTRSDMDVTDVRNLQLVVQGVKEQQDRLEQLLERLVFHHAPESSKDADGRAGERKVQSGSEDPQGRGRMATVEPTSLVATLGSRCEDVTLSMSPSNLKFPPPIGSIAVEESALNFWGLGHPGLPMHSSARESQQSAARPRTPGGECPRTTFRGKREMVGCGEEAGEAGRKVITVDIT